MHDGPLGLFLYQDIIRQWFSCEILNSVVVVKEQIQVFCYFILLYACNDKFHIFYIFLQLYNLMWLEMNMNIFSYDCVSSNGLTEYTTVLCQGSGSNLE